MSYIHGLSDTRLYHCWVAIKQRTGNPSNDAYPNYGGRGIKMCPEWESDFMSFYTWAMANGYEEDLTIDRIDVDGNYEPTNCRWITKKEQSLNRRNSRHITIDGKSQTLKQWTDELGLEYDSVVDGTDTSEPGVFLHKAYWKEVRAHKTNDRRANGIRPMEEYNEERREKKLSKVEEMHQHLAENPKISNVKLGKLMGISESYVRKLKKSIGGNDGYSE